MASEPQITLYEGHPSLQDGKARADIAKAVVDDIDRTCRKWTREERIQIVLLTVEHNPDSTPAELAWQAHYHHAIPITAEQVYNTLVTLRRRGLVVAEPSGAHGEFRYRQSRVRQSWWTRLFGRIVQ